MNKYLIILIITICSLYGQADLPYVTVIDDTVVFEIRDLNRNCGALFEMNAQLEGNIFTIVANDTGDMALCGDCYFDVEIIVNGVSPGDYVAEFFSSDAYDYDSTGATINDTTYIGQLQFSVISNNGINLELLSSNQSECSHTQSVLDEYVPDEYILLNNYPNPFNSSTVIEFYLSNNQNISLSIHDIDGRIISELVKENYNSGFHTISWNPTKLSSGLYFVSINTKSQSRTKKLLLIK